MRIITLLCTLCISALAFAKVEDETLRLHRCYGLFVKERIPANDPLWIAVKSGTKSGTDACMELFDKASLGDNGEIVKYPDGNFDYEGMKVLKSFNDLHRSFFEIESFHINLDSLSLPTINVIDTNEPAYHFTYGMFKKDDVFSQIVTRDSSLKSIRFSRKSARTKGTNNLPLSFMQGSNAIPNPTFTTWSPRVVETGVLIGLEPDQDEIILTHARNKNEPYATGANVNEHFGAGLIGTQAYLIGNAPLERMADGALKLNRRWSKHVFSDLLCRDLPALRSTDVIQNVVKDSQISYKQGISCMGCHSSMDPLSGVIRNLQSDTSGPIRIPNVSTPNVRYWFKIPSSKNAEPFPTITKDADFYLRPTEGSLFYRSYDGTLVEQNVTDIAELGQALAQTNDLYVCAAKRYYKFLTGITVDLSDSGNINSPVLSPAELIHRNKIIKMGLDLKNHQKVRQLIKTIIEMPTFVHPDKGV